MKMILESQDRIRLEMGGNGFEIASEGASISPYHLLAGSLASCTALTLESWAQSTGIDMGRLTIGVRWRMADHRPKRITHLDMDLQWPGLRSERLAAAERVADLCPIHATLGRAAVISRRIVPGDGR